MPQKRFIISNLPEDSIKIEEYGSRNGIIKLVDVYYSKSQDRIYQKSAHGFSAKFPSKLGRIKLYDEEGKLHQIAYETFKFFIDTLLNDRSKKVQTIDGV